MGPLTVASGSGAAAGSATVASGSTPESRPAAGCATVASGSNFCLGSSAILVGNSPPEAAILGAEQPFRELDFRLRDLHPGRGRRGRAPKVAVARRIGPFARLAYPMVLAYFLDFSGVFDDEIIGTDEIG